MYLRPRFFRGLAMAAVLGVGLAACSEDVTIPETPTITAAPQTITLDVGQSQQIVAATSVAGGVSFESLNPSVASVTAAGLVMGLAQGPATIRVYATSQPALQTGVAVTVTAPVIPPTDSARVMIQSVTTSQTISPVDPDSVVGVIDITLSVERGPADQLRVLVNGAEVPTCTQTFGATGAITVDGLSIGAAEQSVVCSLDTRDFTRVGNRGIPDYPNGPLVITAELREGNNVLDSAQTGQYTLANADYMQAYVATYVLGSSLGTLKPSVLGDTGLQWFGNGDLVLTFVPVIYSAATETATGYPAQVSVNFDGYVAGGDVEASHTVMTRTDGGFVVEFPKGAKAGIPSSAVLGGFNTSREGTQLHVTSVTNGGQPGPRTAYSSFTGNPLPSNRVSFTDLQSGTALANSILRLDNESPQAGRLILEPHPAVKRVWARNGWVNGAVDFRRGKDGSHDAPYYFGGGSVGAAGTSKNSSAFGSLSSLPSDDDAVYGVGADTTAITIYALRVPEGSVPSTSTVVTTGTAVTTSSGLAETLTNSEYAVVARVLDRLGNFSDILLSRADPVLPTESATQTGTLSLIGVDNLGAAITVTDTIGTRYNPLDTLSVLFTDTSAAPVTEGPSGIAVGQVRLFSYVCPTGQLQCAPAGSTGETESIPTSVGDSGNSRTYAIGAFADSFSRFLEDVTVNRYHRYDSKVWDRAGNITGPFASDDFIRDAVPGDLPTITPIAPLVSNVAIPTVTEFDGGQSYPWSARVTDNVDVRLATFGFDFDTPTGDTYVFPLVASNLTPWGPSHIVLDSLVTTNAKYLRGVQYLDSPSTVVDSVFRPEMARVTAWDHSSPIGAFSSQANNIVPNTWDLGSTTWMQADGGLVNRIEWEADDRLAVRGQTGTFLNPFTEVLFYLYLPDFDQFYLIGSSTNIAVQDTGALPDGRIWRFTPPAIPDFVDDLDLDYVMYALGINASGDGILSEAGPTNVVP